MRTCYSIASIRQTTCVETLHTRYQSVNQSNERSTRHPPPPPPPHLPTISLCMSACMHAHVSVYMHVMTQVCACVCVFFISLQKFGGLYTECHVLFYFYTASPTPVVSFENSAHICDIYLPIKLTKAIL